MTRLNRRWVVILLSANAAFWVCFWIYFFTHPTTPAPQAVWEGGAQWAKVFGRSFGDGNSLHETVSVPVVRVVTIVFLPCVLVTWPLPHFAPGTFEIAGSDAQGVRLILVTVLSFVQWLVIMRLWSLISRLFAKCT
jgi:hypothetical protein